MWLAGVELWLFFYDAASRGTVILGLLVAALTIAIVLIRAGHRRSSGRR